MEDIKKRIKEAIQTTLVVSNKQSIDLAVDKVYDALYPSEDSIHENKDLIKSLINRTDFVKQFLFHLN